MTDRTPAGAPQGAYLAVREVDVTHKAQFAAHGAGPRNFIDIEELSPRLLDRARQEAHCSGVCACFAMRDRVLDALISEAVPA